MSKTIDAVYNADPSAGNDPSINYKFPSTDGTTSAVALDMDQIAAAVSVRIGTSPPPNETENLAQLVITIQDNTLVPNVQPITGVDYTHYIVVTDSDVVPTYPTGFTQGSLPSLLPALASWVAETKYVYLYDLPTTTQKTLTTPSGEIGITLTPVDNIAPNLGALTAAKNDAGDPETEILIGYDGGSDAVSGIDYHEIFDGISTNLLAANVSTGAFPITISGLIGGQTHNIGVRTFDNAGNSSATQDDELIPVTLDTPSATGGVVEFDTSGVTNLTFEVDQDSGTLNIPVKITGRTQTTSTTAVDIISVDDTAIGGTNFVVYNATVTFPMGGNPQGNQNATLTVNASPVMSANKTLQMHIVPASITGDGSPTIGAIDAVIVKINGTGAAEGSYEEVTITGAVTGLNAEVITVDCINYDNLVGYSSTKTFIEYTAYVGSRNGTYLREPSGDNYKDPALFQATAPRLDFNIVTANSGERWVWLRCLADRAWRDEVWMGTDGANTFSGSDSYLEYTGHIEGTDSGNWLWELHPETINLSAGEHILNLWSRETVFPIDAICVADGDSSVFDPRDEGGAGTGPGTDDNLGPPVSTKATGVVDDDPSNIQIPTDPIPSTTIAPDTVVPAVSATNVPLLSTVTATFNDVANLTPTSFVVTETGVGVVAGTYQVITNTGSQSVVWKPTSLGGMEANAAHTWAITGTAVDNNVVKSIAYSSGAFTTVDSSGFISIWDGSNYASGTSRQLTLSDLEADLPLMTGTHQVDAGYFWAVPDPTGDTSRGTVMRLFHPGGIYANLDNRGQLFINIEGFTPTDEMHYAVDIYLPDTGQGPSGANPYQWNAGMKIGGGFRTGAFVSLETVGETYLSQRLMIFGHDAEYSIPPGLDKGSFMTYGHFLNEPRFTRMIDNVEITPGNYVDPTRDISYQELITHGRWDTYEVVSKINTFTAGVPNADGYWRIYKNGELRYDLSNHVVASEETLAFRIAETFQLYFGGDNARWDCPQDQYCYMDNVIVSDSPITY